MADNSQAGAAVGVGDTFATDDILGGPTGNAKWPFAKLAWGALDTANVVDDAVGKRVPTKPIGPKGSLTDKSGTIAAGNTSQQLAAANSAREYLFVQNQHVSESLFLNFSAAAAQDKTSIELKPNGTFLMTGPGFVCTDAVNVIATTLGHAFAAKEG